MVLDWLLQNKDFFRLSEWSEETVLKVHRGFIFTVSVILTSVYCNRGNGICRAQPMLSYLNDTWYDGKFRRDPVSLGFLVFLITSVAVLQIFIELKKWKARIEAENAAKAAEAAKKSLDEARLRLELSERRKSSLPSRRCVRFKVDLEEKKNNNNALKFARAVALFAVLPVSFFLVLFSLETIEDWRPHGVTIAIMLAFGIVVPAILFLQNLRLRKFATSELKNSFPKFRGYFKSSRVEPLIATIS